jgi:hypothetical protein
MADPTNNPMARAALGGTSGRRTTGATGEVAADGVTRKATSDLMIELDVGRHRELKVTAAMNDTTVAAIVRGLIAEYLDDEELRTRINLRFPRR